MPPTHQSACHAGNPKGSAAPHGASREPCSGSGRVLRVPRMNGCRESGATLGFIWFETRRSHQNEGCMSLIQIAFVYISLRADETAPLYIGSTVDLNRRIYEHRERSLPGFSSRYGVVLLVYYEAFGSSLDARAAEYAIKKWRRAWKLKLMEFLQSRLDRFVSVPPFLIAALLCSRSLRWTPDKVPLRSTFPGTCGGAALGRGGRAGRTAAGPSPLSLMQGPQRRISRAIPSIGAGKRAECDAATPRRSTRGHAMAGHSQFKNIMHRKGKQDAIRSKLFSKLAREITVAAKMGLPDPDMNAAAARRRRGRPAPRTCPRTISSGPSRRPSGADAETYDEVRYEGYAPAASRSSSRR